MTQFIQLRIHIYTYFTAISFLVMQKHVCELCGSGLRWLHHARSWATSSDGGRRVRSQDEPLSFEAGHVAFLQALSVARQEPKVPSGQKDKQVESVFHEDRPKQQAAGAQEERRRLGKRHRQL